MPKRHSVRRLAAKRGKECARVAVGYSLLTIIYHLLKNNVEYHDLGREYFEKLEPERLRRYLVKRLQNLGYNVTWSSTNPNHHAA